MRPIDEIANRTQAILDAIRIADHSAKDAGYMDTGELWELLQDVRANALHIKRAARVMGWTPTSRRQEQRALPLD